VCLLYQLGGHSEVSLCMQPLASAVKGIPVYGVVVVVVVVVYLYSASRSASNALWRAYGVACIRSSEIKQVPLRDTYNKLCQAIHIPCTSPHYLHNMHTHRVMIILPVITQSCNIHCWANVHTKTNPTANLSIIQTALATQLGHFEKQCTDTI